MVDKKKGINVVKCVVVGDGAVGKTSMILGYTTGGFLTDYMPTCFESYAEKAIFPTEQKHMQRYSNLVNWKCHSVRVPMNVADRQYDMSLVDTAGQETYDRLRTLTYYNTDVFVVCFSVADLDSFENVRSKWIPEIKHFKHQTPILIVGTQSDLRDDPDSILTDSVVTTRAGKKFAKRVGAKAYLECSALKQTGVDEVFQRALSFVVAPKKRRPFWKSFKSVFRIRVM